MSALTALSLVLFIGLVATGLVGFFGWRQRMREAAVFTLSSAEARHTTALRPGER
jgi:hypothetical protein